MPFAPTEFIPQPRDWFSTEITYQGHGQAEFKTPVGTVKGPAEIRFREFADPSIEMEIQDVETETPLQFGLLQFFTGEQAVGEQMSLTLRQNPCTKLEVKTPKGIFSSIGDVHYNPSIPIAGNQRGTLCFILSTSQFDTPEAGEAKYWVLPLSNFVWDFDMSFDRLLNPPYSHLDRHPLRICPIPAIPDGLAPEDAMRARWHANSKNHLIVFEFQGSKGFIEPLADFRERRNKLESGQERCLITAVMVGEVNQNSIDFTDLKTWFPYDFLRLLGLATGVDVGTPWVEFRDAQGKLLRRIHWRINRSSFLKGYETIDERIHRHGIGRLLTQSSSSPEFGKSYLRVVLRQIIKGGPHNSSLEDRMAHLCRGFECLCTHYDLNAQNLLNCLDSAQQSQIKIILQKANAQIQSIGRKTTNRNHVRILQQIANRTLNVANKDKAFGLAVVDLLSRFKLPDADIVDTYYHSTPRADGMKWSSVLSKYRGTVMHEGYFDIHKYDYHDIWTVENHLHDILVRIVFKILGYNGCYQPTVVKYRAAKKPNWVTPSLSARELGYSLTPQW